MRRTHRNPASRRNAAATPPGSPPPTRLRRTGRVPLPLLLLIAALFLPVLSPPCFSQEQPVPAPSATLEETEEGRMTLVRNRDPVVLRNRSLGDLLDGASVHDVALYAYDGRQFHRIPFQFDFIGQDGLVIPSHVNRVMEKAVYDFVPNEKVPDRLVPPYELLFMTKDMGDRYAGDGIPEGFTRAMEIRVQETRGTGSGWVYLMEPRFRASPAEKDYVNYTLIRKGHQNVEQIQAESYTTGFPDADKPFAYGYWMIPNGAGGTGVNLLQTFRVRINMKILFFHLELDPKNNIIPYVIGYNDGPVRVTRRVFSSVVLKGIKMDRFMGDAKLETESHYYGSFFYFDGEVSLPDIVKKISKIQAMFTTDFSANATGMKWYNTPNEGNRGCLVDGKMSPQELALDPSPYLWSLLVGPQGGWANILQMHTQSVKPNMNLFYLDDSAYRNEKDPDLNGTWASTGYSLEKLDEVDDKVTFRTTILAIPDTFQVPNTRELVNLVYHPPHGHVERTWKLGP